MSRGSGEGLQRPPAPVLSMVPTALLAVGESAAAGDAGRGANVAEASLRHGAATGSDTLTLPADAASQISWSEFAAWRERS